MASCTAEHHSRKVGLGETGGTAPTGRGRPLGGINVLQGGGSIDPSVWVRDVGNLGINGEEGVRDSHWVPYTDYGEASA